MTTQDGHTRPSRRLAAILAADIAGYSALMGADEARTVQDLKGHRSFSSSRRCASASLCPPIGLPRPSASMRGTVFLVGSVNLENLQHFFRERRENNCYDVHSIIECLPALISLSIGPMACCGPRRAVSNWIERSGNPKPDLKESRNPGLRFDEYQQLSCRG